MMERLAGLPGEDNMQVRPVLLLTLPDTPRPKMVSSMILCVVQDPESLAQCRSTRLSLPSAAMRISVLFEGETMST